MCQASMLRQQQFAVRDPVLGEWVRIIQMDTIYAAAIGHDSALVCLKDETVLAYMRPANHLHGKLPWDLGEDNEIVMSSVVSRDLGCESVDGVRLPNGSIVNFTDFTGYVAMVVYIPKVKPGSREAEAEVEMERRLAGVLV